MHRLLSLFAIVAICTIAAPADAMCIITIAPPKGPAAANGGQLQGCPRIYRGAELRSPRTGPVSARDTAVPAAAAEMGRSARDARITRALGQGYLGFKKVHKGQRYTGFKKVYRGQRYLGFRKVYSGPLYPADLYGGGSRWSF